nr:MAG TPA: hypothetical protein [Caudoviricetes sp.]
MSEKLEELISLLYQDRLTQCGKRLLVENIEKLQKENEELKKLHIQDNKHLDFIMKHSISVQKVKDRIEKYKKLSDKFYVKFLESDRYNTDIREKGIKCDAIILALEELIEEREEK